MCQHVDNLPRDYNLHFLRPQPIQPSGHGATGVVYPVSDLLVVKTIYLLNNPLPDHEEMVHYSREGISKESKMFDHFHRVWEMASKRDPLLPL